MEISEVVWLECFGLNKSNTQWPSSRVQNFSNDLPWFATLRPLLKASNPIIELYTKYLVGVIYLIITVVIRSGIRLLLLHASPASHKCCLIQAKSLYPYHTLTWYLSQWVDISRKDSYHEKCLQVNRLTYKCTINSSEYISTLLPKDLLSSFVWYIPMSPQHQNQSQYSKHQNFYYNTILITQL